MEMNIDAEEALYADMPFVGCVTNTIGYCCLSAGVAYASVSASLPKQKKTKKKKDHRRKYDENIVI